MALRVQDFAASPKVLPPSGGQVAFSFRAQGTGNPSHMRARIRIPAAEPFVFSNAHQGGPRELFIPGAQTTAPVPTQLTSFNAQVMTLAPDGPVNPAREQPLRIDIELQGFDANGQAVGAAQPDSLLITFDTLSTALSLLSTNLGLTQGELSERLGVSPSTLRTAMRGGSSPKVRAALDKVFRG